MRTAGYNPPFLNDGSGGGAVESVTGASPIASTGGANPEISIGLASDSAFGAVKVDGTTITAAAGVISAVGGAGVFRLARVRLTASQIAALNSTPVLALAAPGSGKMIAPISPFKPTGPATPGTGVMVQSLAGDPWTIFGVLSLSALWGTDLSTSPVLFSDDGNSLGNFLGSDAVGFDFFTQTVQGGAKSQFENIAINLVANLDSTGRIVSASLQEGGTAYAPGDTFTILNFTTDDATGVIDTVDGGGAVLTYHLTAQGTGYFPLAAHGSSNTSTSGAGSGFVVNIDAIESVADGSGDVIITFPYVVADLD